MKIEKLGEYKCADETKAVVSQISDGAAYGVYQPESGGWFACYWNYETGANLDSSSYSIVDVWTEPEELVPHYPAVLEHESQFVVSNAVFETIEEAKESYGDDFIRIATEYPPIMLRRRKT